MNLPPAIIVMQEERLPPRRPDLTSKRRRAARKALREGNFFSGLILVVGNCRAKRASARHHGVRALRPPAGTDRAAGVEDAGPVSIHFAVTVILTDGWMLQRTEKAPALSNV
jgi:hypothetical protein